MSNQKDLLLQHLDEAQFSLIAANRCLSAASNVIEGVELSDTDLKYAEAIISNAKACVDKMKEIMDGADELLDKAMIGESDECN